MTRAVEILGERWTLLILRELFLGPKRFSDLKAALNGVSTSVLTDRLAKLEERGVVLHRELPPPSASAVYELDEAGRALRPLLAELTRWGVRFLGAPGPGDRIRPEWLQLGFQVFARSGDTEDIGAHLHVEDGAESVDIYVRGGKGGTTVSSTSLPHEVVVRAPALQMLLFATGILTGDAPGAPSFEGDAAVAARIPSLFDFRPTPAEPAARPGPSPTDQPGAGRRARPQPRPAARRGRPGAAGS